MSIEMDSKGRLRDDSTAIHKFGDTIDISNADALTGKCGRYFGDPAVKRVVFDLENVRMCDSYGVKFLINSQRKAAGSNKELVLYRLEPALKEMLEVTHLIQFFTIADRLP